MSDTVRITISIKQVAAYLGALDEALQASLDDWQMPDDAPMTLKTIVAGSIEQMVMGMRTGAHEALEEVLGKRVMARVAEVYEQAEGRPMRDAIQVDRKEYAEVFKQLGVPEDQARSWMDRVKLVTVTTSREDEES